MTQISEEIKKRIEEKAFEFDSSKGVDYHTIKDHMIFAVQLMQEELDKAKEITIEDVRKFAPELIEYNIGDYNRLRNTIDGQRTKLSEQYDEIQKLKKELSELRNPQSFIEFVGKIHPDPDTLLGKKVSECFEELQKLAHSYSQIELDRLRKENENLKTVMIAAAEEIKEHWQAHCDEEGYGPANLMHRLEKGIPSQYGYTAGAFLNQEQTIKGQLEIINKLNEELAALKKQVEEMKEVMRRAKAAMEHTGIKWEPVVKSMNELDTYITDKQI